MRWLTDYVKATVKNGEVRLKPCFAWLPVNIKGIIVWLERYQMLQVYRIKSEIIKMDGEETTFLLGKWINLAKRCK